ncbi:VCBS repeat-containing protein [Streptomyces sp. NPDC007100]|uniref:FG-GAP repeat domain-containing protein n=1 Tax=Streptomyces sp. NPDC007100 TaxID=3155602 RepID=UPI0033C35FA0
MFRTDRVRRRFRLARAAAAAAVTVAAAVLPTASATAATPGPPASAPAAHAAQAEERPAAERPALYARDHSGVLWRYEGTGYSARPFKPPVKIGGGWDEYVEITSLNGTAADGTGDAVAVNTEGMLFFYKGSGNPSQPFAPRIQIGLGWDRYVSIAGAADANHDGKADLVARDRNGVLWFYAGTGVPEEPFEPPVRVGGGWHAYQMVVTYGDGVLARDLDDVLWVYKTSGSVYPSEPFYPRVRVGTGLAGYADFAGVRDIDGDGFADVVARDFNGKLWLHGGERSQGMIIPSEGGSLIGGGWNIYNKLF